MPTTYTKETLISWLNNSTRVRHQETIENMALFMKPWVLAKTKQEINELTEGCFFASGPSDRALGRYQELISSAIIQLRQVAAKEPSDNADYIVALMQSVLEHAPTNKAAFKKWLGKNAERIFNETYPASLWNFSNNFRRYNPELTNKLHASLFKLKTNCTTIAEAQAPEAPKLEIDQKVLNSAKQFNAAFRNIPSKVLKIIISNIVQQPALDKTQLEILIKKILSSNNVHSDFLTKSHIGQAWKLKEQVRGLLDTKVNVSHPNTVGPMIGTAILSSGVATATRYGAYYAGYKPEHIVSDPAISRSSFFMLHALLLAPISNAMGNKLPAPIGSLIKEMNKMVSLANPIPHVYKLTRRIIGTQASQFFLYHNLANFFVSAVGWLTPSSITNLLSRIVPSFLSSGISALNNTITTVNPFILLPNLASSFINSAAEVILDDEHILPLVATVSLLAVVAYRSPELNHLYTKLKNSLLEYTGESEENWDAFEDEFAIEEPEALLLLSGGHQLSDSVIYKSSSSSNDEFIVGDLKMPK